MTEVAKPDQSRERIDRPVHTGAKRGGLADASLRWMTGKRWRVAEAAHTARDRRTKRELLREMVGVVAECASNGGCVGVNSLLCSYCIYCILYCTMLGSMVSVGGVAYPAPLHVG